MIKESINDRSKSQDHGHSKYNTRLYDAYLCQLLNILAFVEGQPLIEAVLRKTLQNYVIKRQSKNIAKTLKQGGKLPHEQNVAIYWKELTQLKVNTGLCPNQEFISFV